MLFLTVFLLSPVYAAGEPVPRVICPAGYTVTVYADGLSSPDGLTFSPDGQLYVAEETAGQVSRIDSVGIVVPVLTGLASPEGIAFDAAGNLYVVEDVQNGRLLKMPPGATTIPLATGLDAPEGVTVASDNTIYLTESNIQFSSPFSFQTGVTAVSGGNATSVRTDALFWSYSGIAPGPGGLLYVTNEASGTGTHDSIFTIVPATGSRTLFTKYLRQPEGLRFASNGTFPLYVAEEDTGSGAGKISRIEADGTHLPLCTGFYTIEDVAVDKRGRLFVSEDGSGQVLMIEPPPPTTEAAQAIILFIGDGMGEVHRRAARWRVAGQSEALAMDLMPAVGWSRTASANSAVTDSAAGGTAIATGVKTNNGVIGMDADLNPVTSILETAQARGMAVGLVTTTQMAHATPASFAAHIDSRDKMTDIATQMLAAGVDVLLGGGEDEFLPSTETGCYSEFGERDDGHNLITEAQAAGYTYVCNAAELSAVNPATTSKLLGLFDNEGINTNAPTAPTLTDMTQTAIDILSQDSDGFFLMVEGGQIDWAGHANNAASVISSTIAFDQAVSVGQNYAATVTNTLIIVTADHETGGMAVDLTTGGGANEDGPFLMPDGSTAFYVNWKTGGHTGVDVPVTAQGPWSHLLDDTFENTHLHHIMSIALNPHQIWLPIIQN